MDISRLTGAVDKISFSYIPRSFNKAAHRVAKFSNPFSYDKDWSEAFPAWLGDSVLDL